MSVKPVPKLAPSMTKTKNAASSVGAPAQHNQASRKGKKAWRKNVNIEEIEQGMEGLRAEERVTGCVHFLYSGVNSSDGAQVPHSERVVLGQSCTRRRTKSCSKLT